ncbi:MAG: UbiD family decarboxylase, partial [Geminicoccaceae bacterium]|nr:UbiD family decarboxylase [Geminicoccaceae bacterium]
MKNYASLREFMDHLEERGRLVRVREPVSPRLEITEIHTRLLAEQGPAVLFENVEGSAMPLLTNLFGTVERVAWGMGREPSELRAVGEMLAFFRQPQPPESFREAIGMMPLMKAALSMKPRTTNHAPCQEIVLEGNDIDLGRLPIQSCWPGEPA